MMIKKLLLHRIPVLGGLLLLLMSGILNAQTRNLNAARSQNIQLIPQAEAPDSKAEQSVNALQGNPLEMMKGKAEDISKRDAFSKHYKNTDGSMTALIGSGPIHYFKNGSYENIETKITPQTDAVYSFANQTNLFESYFGAKSSAGIKNKTIEGEVKEFLNTQMYWEVKGQPKGLIHSANVPATIDGDKAYYKNIYGSISAEFTSLVGKRKLNYILPNLQALGNIPSGADYLVFSEDLVLPKGWVHSITEDGILIKNRLGKEIYLYNNPTSTDASNQMLSEQNTVFETSLNGNILTIRTKVKTVWLLNSQRRFPVMVDPTVTVWPTGIGNYVTGTVNAGGTKWANNDIYAGMRTPLTGTSTTRSLYRGWASFNLTTLPTNINITSATFGFYTGINTLYSPDGQYLLIGQITSGIPNVATGATLYNMCGEFDGNTANQWFTLSAGQPTGDMTIDLAANQRNAIVSSIPSGIISLGFRPKGNYSTSYTEQVGIYGSNRPQSTISGRPYFILTYEELSADRTLTVSNAYPGATYANGVTTFTNKTSVTATSGTRTGYNVTGWTGTGSVPATGTTGSSTFTITQNSTIDWKWQQIGLPNNIVFYNYGTTEQLAFNNSRSNTTTPIFRLSHGTDPATDYEIEINPSPTFAAGTSWAQTFTGTYPLNTQANFTFTNGFTPVTGTTYYVRVRVKGAANTYSAWTAETYSFTHDTTYIKPYWFQTTQPQFTTDALSGTTADSNNDIIVAPATDPIKNGNFATATNWTPTKSYQGTITFPSTDCLNCSGGTTTNLKMFLNGNDAFTGDYMMVSQQVDLTNVDQITYNAASYYATSASAPGRYSSLKFMIGGTATNTVGDDLHTTNQAFTSSTYSNNTLNDPNVVINTQGYTGIQTIKFVVKFSAQVLGTPLTSFYVNNVKAISTSNGTITSTPIALSSVQNVTRFEKLLWNQSLGGGTMNFKIQQTALGTNTGWTDVAGYTNISATGNGEKEFDLSAMTGYEQIRLVGTLNGSSVKMHDWAVIYEEPCDKLWSSTSSTDWGIRTNWIPPGIPTAKNCVKIPSRPVKPTIQVGTDALAKNLTIESDGQLVVQGNLTVTDFINNGGSATDLTVESDGNLVQVNPATNTGEITLQRNSKMKRLDYIYWGAPVAGQNFINFSPNTVASRFYRYNEEFDSFHTIANLNDPMIAGQGYAIRAPNNQNTTTPTSWTGIFKGKPNNGVITVPVTKHDDSPIDPNNPLSQLIPRGKNMLSNPYPSNLDLEALSDANPVTANGVYYFWTNTNDFVDNTQVPGNGEYGNYGSNHYATYSSSGAVPAANADSQLPTRYIRPGQGFLFEAKLGGTVTFNNSMRSIDSNSTFISNKGTENSPERFWLKLTTPINNSNTLLVAYISGATNSFEPRYDARFPQKSSDRFYSIIEDQELIIQGRQYPFVKTDLVPLGMAHFVAGNYRIEIADREGIFAADQNIYLKDRQTGIITNLSQESYTYSAQAGENNTRFEIIYEPETVLVTNDRTKGSCIIYRDATDFVVKSSDQTIENIELYEAGGRLILKVNGNNRKEVRFPAHQVQKGIYVLKAFTKGGIIIKKMINH